MHKWQTKKLGEVCDVFMDGDWIEKKDQANDGIRLIQTGNVGNGVFKMKEGKERYVSFNTFEKLNCTEIFQNDCLISRLPDPIGRACLIPNMNIRMITAVDCTILRFKKEKISPQWFIYFSLSENYQNQIDKKIGGATRQRISRKNLGQIEIPLPSLPEQHRIVKILDEAFAAIAKAKENAEKNLHNASEFYNLYLQKIFNSSEESNEILLGKIANFRNGINYTKRSKGELIKIVGVKDFQKSYYVPLENLEFVTIDDKLPELDILKENDILAVRSNGNPQLIGRCILAKNITGKISHSGFTIRIRLNSKEILPEYLCHYLKSPNTRKQLVSSGTGINIKSLNQTTLSSLVIFIPPLHKQKEIVAQLDTLSTETKKLEALYRQKLAGLEELKKSILQKAFRGELAHEEVKVKKETFDWFRLKQVIGVIIQNFGANANQRGEMVIAKCLYFLQKEFDVPTKLQFVKGNFGPYTADIKKAILGSAFGKDKFFTVRGSKERQVFALGVKSSQLFKYDTPELAQARFGMSELIKKIGDLPSKEIELIATICKIIEDSQTTDIDIIRTEMKNWKLENREGESKVDIFDDALVMKYLDWIKLQRWDKKLLKNTL